MSACSGSKQLDRPEQTFEKLVDAIQHRDLEAYKSCCYAQTAEREGMISQLEINPALWDELQSRCEGR